MQAKCKEVRWPLTGLVKKKIAFCKLANEYLELPTSYLVKGKCQ
jgi:hypothetical protein